MLGTGPPRGQDDAGSRGGRRCPFRGETALLPAVSDMSNLEIPDLKPVIAALRSGYQHHTGEWVHGFADAHGLSVAELLNVLSLAVANRFMAGEMPYDEADDIANTIYAVMMEDAAAYGSGFELPEPAFAIYDAFDAGEWNRGDGVDPVERRTKPALRRILNEHPGTWSSVK
jgi:hypothetical protein